MEACSGPRRGWAAAVGVAVLAGAVALDAACGAPPPAAAPPAPAPSDVAPPAADDSPARAFQLAPLSTVPVPAPAGGDVVDRAAAVRLGKALFWDVQAGSDGRVACATCHYHAGADARRTNALNPGPDGVFTAGGVTGPGQALPEVSFDADDRVGSAGTAAALFVGNDPDPAVPADRCTPVTGPPFGSARAVTPRQAPSVVGAVFYRVGFWDGRASDRFNRADLWGPLTSAGPFVERAPLASQAVAPPATFEMSCLGRRLDGPDGLGAKLLARRPLALQQVAPDDAVLGALSAAPAPGLAATYADLLAAAFGPDAAAAAEDRFTALWAQAIAAYEATLVPDATPLDRFLAGDEGALSAPEQRGLALFRNKAGCVHCHAGPELSDASLTFASLRGLVNEDGGDQGFHNLGVRPTAEDLGRGGSGVMDLPLSESDALADRGAFKTPGLRNVALTAPYFHDGAKATLADVLEFYDRGGDFANPEKARRMVPLHLADDEKAALQAFLEGALTDPRVACEAAPFDHPALAVPDGPALPATGARGRGCP